MIPTLDQSWRDAGVTSCQCAPLSSVRQIRPSSVPAHIVPFFSGDGHTLVFSSYASDLLGGDFNHSSDVFALGLLYASITAGLPGFGPTISWPARPGETYHVQFKDALTDAVWQEASDVITITGDRAQLTDLAPSNSQRFYRIAAN